MSVDFTAHSMGTAKDSLTGREAEGILITMYGKQRFLSKRSFWQVLQMELAGEHEKEMPPANGVSQPVAAKRAGGFVLLQDPDAMLQVHLLRRHPSYFSGPTSREAGAVT